MATVVSLGAQTKTITTIGEPEYKIHILNHSGEPVEIFTAYSEMHFIHEANNKGSLVLVLLPTHESLRNILKEETSLDYLIEIYRQNKVMGIEWYKEWEGLYQDFDDNINDENVRTFTTYWVGLNDLIDRRKIMFFKDETLKAGTGGDIIKEYVRENAGYLATTTNGRILYGVTPNLVVRNNLNDGLAWVGNKNMEPLLKACQDIGEQTGVYFYVKGQSDYTWLFITSYPAWNKDRRVLDIDGDGLNSAGNVPMLFASKLGNIRNPTRTRNFSNSKNVILALAQDEAKNTYAVVRQDFESSGLSPLNYREEVVNVGQITDTDALISAADEKLEIYRETDEFIYEIIQTPNSYYGKHYWRGDLVSVMDNDGNLLHKVVSHVAVSVSYNDNGERIDIVTEDIPNA